MTDTVSAIQKFKIVAREFAQLWNELYAYRDFAEKQPEKIRVEYNNLMRSGKSIKSTVSMFTRAIDTVSGAYHDILDFFKKEPAQLEVVPPLIALGGAAGVAATTLIIGKWVKDAKLIKIRLDEMRRLEAQGVPPAKAQQIVAGLTKVGGGLFDSMGAALMPLMLTAGAIWLIPKFLEKK